MSIRSNSLKIRVTFAIIVTMIGTGIIAHREATSYWAGRGEIRPYNSMTVAILAAIFVGSVIISICIGVARSRQRKLSTLRREGTTGYFGTYGHRDRV
ncbi:MAG: hypothetical protein ABIQ04_00875 [Candidatus Saccharimonadales bacterium]